MEENKPKPFKAVTLLAFEYNYNQNRIVTALVKADAGDTLQIVFNYSLAPVITVDCETRRLTLPETSELLQWAYNMPKTFSMLNDLAHLTHAFFKV